MNRMVNKAILELGFYLHEMEDQETIQIGDLRFEILLPEVRIRERIGEMGAAIGAEFAGRKPLFLGVLNGAFIFMADLVRASQLECEVSFIKLSSYRGLSSTGSIREVIGLEEDIRGRDVILVEDIIDTGRTLYHFLPRLREMGPASVSVVSLLVKPDMMEHPLQIDHRGFSIPPRFVVGFGLDYNGFGRNLGGIYQLKE